MTRILLAALILVLAALPASASGPDPERIARVLPRFRELIQEGMKATGVPALSVAVVKDGKVVMLEGFGVAEAGPVTPDTVFQLASCSKPVTSTAIAALVGQGKLTFDSPVVDLDPSFRLSEPWVTAHVTLRDLLSHRSGLPGAAGNDLEQLGYDAPEILHRLRFVDLGNRFRSDYSYSNFGFSEAGFAAARAHGGSFASMLEDLVFRPLGMTRSSAAYADFARVPDRALGHILEGGKAVQRYDRRPDAQAPAGGVNSTARDMSRFALLHLGHGPSIAPREVLQATHEPIMVTRVNPATFGKAGFYGMGWGSEEDRHGVLLVKHSGAFSTGSRTQIVLVPQEDLGVVILVNAFPTGLPEGLSQALLDLYLDGEASLEGVLAVDQGFRKGMAGLFPSLGKRPPNPSPPLPGSAYAGSYDSEFFGPARVESTPQGLVLRMGSGMKVSGPLEPWDRDTFAWRGDPEDGPFPSLVRFALDPDGRAESMTVGELDGFGLGTFGRK